MLERLPFFRRTLPYQMFDRQRFGLEANSAKILERIYHKGQALAWDGQQLLGDLVEQHGVPDLDRDRKLALGRLFAVIMWGELAAWKVSAALAEELDAFEAKMAATSQAHDEARHFYVMHDYLTLLDAMPDRLDRGAETLLSEVIGADHLAKKLLGMQLMVEPIALSLFHVVRRLNIEPVLTGLMPYYERDEARHVALGIKYLPAMLKTMTTRERIELYAFQLRLVTCEMWSSFGMMRDLKTLGVDPRMMANVGRAKQLSALEMLLRELNVDSDLPLQVLDRYGLALLEATIPEGGPLRQRLRRVAQVALRGATVTEAGIEFTH